MDNVIVDLQSVRISVPDEMVEAYYRGEPEATKTVNTAVTNKLKEIINHGADIIEHLEVE